MQLHLTSIDTSSISFFIHIQIERNMENNHSNALIGGYGPSGIRATIDLCIKIYFILNLLEAQDHVAGDACTDN